MKGWLVGMIIVVIVFGVVLLFYCMLLLQVLGVVGFGFVYGLWLIVWIIIGVVFFYKVLVKIGQFDIICVLILLVIEDQCLQMLMVGFVFGVFLEGVVGFGVLVVIIVVLLVGLGFKLLYVVGLCLIVNIVLVVFGVMGILIIVVGQVIGLDVFEIGQMVGCQLLFLIIIVLFWIMVIMDGWCGIKEIWLVVFVVGGLFVIVQYLIFNFIGLELLDIIVLLVLLVCLILFLCCWKLVWIFCFDIEISVEVVVQVLQVLCYSVGQIVRVWLFFLIFIVMVMLWSIKLFKLLFVVDGLLEGWVLKILVLGLDQLVQKMLLIVDVLLSYDVVYKFDWFLVIGILIILVGVIVIIVLCMLVCLVLQIFGEIVCELCMLIYLIGMVLVFVFIVNYLGLFVMLVLVLVYIGDVFLFFLLFLGWLGVFLIGLDILFNVLFLVLQVIIVQQIGVFDVLLVVVNIIGGVIGKMILLQLIVIVCVVVGLVGKELDLFCFMVKYSLIFIMMVGLIMLVQVYWLIWMIF